MKIRTSVAISTFPLPSPTNYALLCNLIVILSKLVSPVYVVTGGLTLYKNYIKELLDYAPCNTFICDIKMKMIERSTAASPLKCILIYILVQLKMLVCFIKVLPKVDVVIFFIGVPHMLPLIVLAKIFKKRIIYY